MPSEFGVDLSDNPIFAFRAARDARDQRRRDQKEFEVMKNYMADPDATIKAVNQIDPYHAQTVKTNYMAQTAAEAANAQTQRDQAAGRFKQVTGYLRAVPPGGDVGAAFDGLLPYMKSQLGITDQEAAQYRDAITKDPSVIASLDDTATKAIMESRYGTKVVPAGGALAVGGQKQFSQPFAPKPFALRRGDGGYDATVFDPNTGTYSGITSTPGAAAGGGAPGVVSGVGAPNGAPGANAPISIRNNNPGALRPDGRSKWRGMTGEEGGFVKFDTPENGRRAQIINLMNQQRFHGINTIAGLINKYAPASDNNNPSSYAATVAAALGVGVNDPINLSDPAIASRVADAQARVESGGAPGTFTSGGQAAPAPGGVTSLSTPGKPQGGVRAATPEELAAANYPAGTAAQIDTATGKFTNIKTPTAGGAGAGGVKAQQQFAKVQTQVEGTVDALDELNGQIDDLLSDPNLNSYVGNIDGILPSWLSQGRRDFNNKLDTIKTKVGMSALQNMRNMSPTGGALGQVSNYENKMLQRSLANLESSSSEKEFRKNLGIVKSNAARARARMLKELDRYPGNPNTAPAAGAPAAPAANSSPPMVGTTARNPQTGATVVWNGKGWVPKK